MRCFYHTDKEAVGSCKSCGKGLCSECATDLAKGLACHGKCEADVKALIELIERNIRISARAESSLSRSQKVLSSAAIFNLVMGTIFIVWGITDTERFMFMLVLGVCFFVYGLVGLARNREQNK